MLLIYLRDKTLFKMYVTLLLSVMNTEVRYQRLPMRVVLRMMGMELFLDLVMFFISVAIDDALPSLVHLGLGTKCM